MKPTRTSLRALTLVLLLAAALACGKYGPPKRRLLETPANAPTSGSSAAPSPGTPSSGAGSDPAGAACEEEPEKPAAPAPTTTPGTSP